MKRKTTQQFISEAIKTHGDSFDYTGIEYTTNKAKITIRCTACNGHFKVSPANHLRGNQCPFCSRETIASRRRISHDDFVARAISIHECKYEYMSECNGYKKNIRIKCLKCGYIFNQMAYSHLRGNGCKKCAEENSRQSQLLSVIEFERRVKEIHSEKYKYLQDYTGYENKVTVICADHGIFRQEAGAHLKGQGCPRCDCSHGELAIENFLKKHGIKHECEKRFPDCRDVKPLAFDFFLPDSNTCIEYDGVQHFFPIRYWGGSKSFFSVRIRDRIKTVYCENKGIRLIRIAFSDYRKIDKILSEYLLCV